MLEKMFSYFTDPILRAPTIGCMLMSISASLMGSLFFVKRRSLIGETLSHATYPGVIFSLYIAVALFSLTERWMMPVILIGAMVSALLGLICIDFLERRFKIASDSALCFVLASFFGAGLLGASRIQFSYSLWYKKAQVFFFGQAATMTDESIFFYGSLSVIILSLIVILYHHIKTVYFDRDFATTIGLNALSIENLLFVLLVSSIVIGIRSVGVVLMSGMLIAPAVAARQYTHKLSKMLFLSAIFGALSAWLGLVLSLEIPAFFENSTHSSLHLPTGPIILLVATSIAILSLVFAPERGLISRMVRIYRFRSKCQIENCLKCLGKRGRGHSFSVKEVALCEGVSYWTSLRMIVRLCLLGYAGRNKDGRFHLTNDGLKHASHILRLHRLWEVYLVDYLGQRPELVHKAAEEIEHVLTPEIEKELMDILKDPQVDPHQQPIPRKGEVL